MLRVGIAKEIKTAEFRVAGLPEHVRQLTQAGCPVVVQRGAGTACAYLDDDYADAGAELVDTLEEVYERADLLWKVKEILPAEFGLLRDHHVVFTYLHAPSRPRMVRAILESGCVAIAYEDMTDPNGRRPLLEPMSRMAGAGAVILAGQFLQAPYGGRAKLLFATDGAEPVTFTILGGGTVGRAAAAAACGAGAAVNLLEVNGSFRAALAEQFARAAVLGSDDATIRRLLPETDVLVNATYWMPGDPHLVTRDMLGLMPAGALIMDVAADPAGAIQTSQETTHDAPLRTVDGVLHYCVQNIPSLFCRSASQTLSHVTWPYARRLALEGVDASVETDPMLANGVNAWCGEWRGDGPAPADDAQ